MKEFKGTKGHHMPIFSDGFCIGVGVKLDVNYYKMTANSILPDTDKEYKVEKEEIEANMRLYAAAPNLLTASIELVESFDGGIENQLYNYEKLLKLKQAIQKALNV